MPGHLERYAPYVGQALGLSKDDVLRSYRPACEDDIPRILALRRRVNGAMWWDDQKFVEWRYFARKTAECDTSYWVFVKDGEALGGCGLEPVTLVVDGTAMPAVRSFDIMVRPDLDGLGLGAFMNLVLFNNFPITLVTGSNERSHALLTRMFHHATNLKFWKTAIRSKGLLEERLGHGSASTAVSWAADPLLTLWRSRHWIVPPPDVAVREVTSFDARVGDLSKRCEVAGRLIVRRTDDLLNWRFVQNPRCRHRMFGAFRGDRLDGYLVTRFNSSRPNPRQEAEIVDWLVAPESGSDASVLPGLIQAGVDALIEDGAGIVSCASTGDIERAMRLTGFHFRPGEQLPFFVHASDPDVHKRLSAGNDWFLTRGDHDVE
jgi:hypothetical protein